MNATIAAITYTVLRAYRMALGEPGGPAWEAAPQALKQKATMAVDWIRSQPEEPTAEALHKRWASSKLIDGWTHGPRSDVMKMHPHVGVDFAQLAKPHQAKGELALALVRTLAPLVLATDKAENECQRIAQESLEEQQGALLYIAAMVNRFGGETGVVQMSKRDMLAALNVELMRHDTADGGLLLKVERPRRANPLGDRDPTVLDTSLAPGG